MENQTSKPAKNPKRMKIRMTGSWTAVAIVITAIILSYTILNRNQKANTISVTGLSARDFTSDLIVWSGSFSRKSMNLKEAYASLDQDRVNIQKYLIAKGLKAENVIFSAVDITKEFDESYDDNGNKIRSIFTGYVLQQTVQVESGEVDKVENISRSITELINQGIEFYSKNPEYYYTKLAELKVQMIAQATQDANLRATMIAENAGGSVGDLKSADMGVFQITGRNSSEEYSWGGSFNTSSKEKTASITVSLIYESD